MAEREEFKRMWKSVMDLGACVRVCWSMVVGAAACRDLLVLFIGGCVPLDVFFWVWAAS